MIKLIPLLLATSLILFASCKGQRSHVHESSASALNGDTVTALGNSIMVVFQDKHDVYWFGSWETGLYRYDGSTLINYTTEHGLLNNRIDEIKEDNFGNIYFGSANATSSISKFDGNKFTTLAAVPSDDWRLDFSDLWFEYSYGNTGKVYRYDGTTLHELQFPKPPDLSNPFDIYSIYKDRKGYMWFGTNPVGVCRYDGKSFEWITEEDVTEFRNEGANGVRSITEDKNGDFWFNTEFRYSVYDSATIKSGKLYSSPQI
ncbi:MAG: two-component regulator propeller domain-containing protein [Flavobacteriales bacterium]